MRTATLRLLIVGTLFVVTTPFALSTARYPAYSREVSETTDGWIVCYSMLSNNSTSAYKTDFSLCNTPGEPATQIRTDVFRLPKGYTADVSLISASYSDSYQTMTGATPLQLEKSTETPVASIITPYTGFKPQDILTQGPAQWQRGQEVVRVTVRPQQYDFENNTVRNYTALSYRLTLRPTSTSTKSNKIVVNPGLYPTTLPIPQTYLIITTPSLAEAVTPLAEWKRMLGFTVLVESRDNWTPESIKACINTTYRHDAALKYLLIVGDHSHVPAEWSTEHYNSDLCGSATHNGHITDLYYGCLDGEDDIYPDIWRGRLPATDLYQAQNIIDKIIWHEKCPVSDADFYKNGTVCAYFESLHRQPKDDETPGSDTRRWIQTSEEVRNYLNLYHNKNINRIYWKDYPGIDNPIVPEYWCDKKYNDAFPDSLKIHRMPKDVIDEINSGKTFIDLVDDINDGRFLVMYRGHGSKEHLESWTFEPPFDQNMINQLTNNEWQPIFFSLTCQSGDFSTNCFANRMLSKLGGGAVGVIAATHYGYTGPNDMLATALIQNIWPTPGYNTTLRGYSTWRNTGDPEYRLGPMLDNALETATLFTNSPSSKSYIWETFHLLGDPSIQIFTEAPTEFDNVSISRNPQGVEVCISPDTATIALYDHISGISYRYISDFAYLPTNNPDKISVVISGHNRIPYISEAETTSTAPSPQNNVINGAYDQGHGVVKIDYRLTLGTTDATIVAVDLTNNRMVGSISVSDQSTTTSMHIGHGIYAISLMVGGIPAHTIRTLIAH